VIPNTGYMSDPATTKRMQDIARSVDWRLPRGWCFFVMIFPPSSGEKRPCNYASNARREDVIKAIKEWMVRGGAQENWMKDIKYESAANKKAAANRRGRDKSGTSQLIHR
jgi:hypothetical protein